MKYRVVIKSLIMALLASPLTSAPAMGDPDPVPIEISSTSAERLPGMFIDYGLNAIKVTYTRKRSRRIAQHGSCAIVVGKTRGRIARALRTSCDDITYTAKLFESWHECVTVKMTYPPRGVYVFSVFTCECDP